MDHIVDKYVRGLRFVNCGAWLARHGEVKPNCGGNRGSLSEEFLRRFGHSNTMPITLASGAVIYLVV